MTLRPPRLSAGRAAQQPIDALDYEIAQEQASALGRLGRRVETTLKALADFDSTSDEARAGADRVALVEAASESLWQFLVQREACGLRDSARVMRDYQVPGEVQARLGAAPRRARRTE
jgi:hypothetical protein